MSESPDIDAGLLSRLNAGDAPATSDDGSDIDHGLLAKLSTPVSSDTASASTTPHTTHHAVAPTRYQQAVAPATLDQPELSIGQTLQEAGKNFLPSVGGVLGGVIHSVVHPVQTAEAVGSLIQGAGSKAEGALGVQQDPKEKANAEKLLNAVASHYKKAYFTSWKDTKQAFATDPASTLMDVSAPLTLAASAPLDAASVAGRVASVAGKIGSYIDPVQNALRVASAPVKLASNALTRGVSSAATGVSSDMYNIARQAGKTTNPDMRAAFQNAVNGQTDAVDTMQKLQTAVKAVRQQASDDYAASKGAMAIAPVKFTNTDAAIQKAYADAQSGATVGPVPKAAMAAIDDARDMAIDVANNPSKNNIQGLDKLKQQIWDLKSHHTADAGNYLNGIYHGAKSDLVSADPKYAALMEDYQRSQAEIQNQASTLGISGKKPAAGAVMAKVIRSMKNKNGADVMGQVAKYDPTIPYAIAGHAVSPVGSGLFHTLGDAAVAGIAGGALAHPMIAMGGLPALAVGAAASSPKLNAAIHYGSGAAGQLADKVAPVADGAYWAGRVGQQDEPDNSAATPMDQAKSAVSGIESGGNYTATGPNVKGDHAYGKYQVMGANVGPWTKEILGHTMTPAQFKNDPEAQEKVFEGKFGQYLQKFGNMQDALSAWHSGVPLSQAVSENRRDPNITTAEYVRHGMAGMGTGNAAGGRIGRASGGKTKLSHEQLVERLMKRAKQAKRGEKEATKPLLNVPDNVVARALEVAQAAI